MYDYTNNLGTVLFILKIGLKLANRFHLVEKFKKFFLFLFDTEDNGNKNEISSLFFFLRPLLAIFLMLDLVELSAPLLVDLSATWELTLLAGYTCMKLANCWMVHREKMVNLWKVYKDKIFNHRQGGLSFSYLFPSEEMQKHLCIPIIFHVVIPIALFVYGFWNFKSMN